MSVPVLDACDVIVPDSSIWVDDASVSFTEDVVVEVENVDVHPTHGPHPPVRVDAGTGYTVLVRVPITFVIFVVVEPATLLYVPVG